MTSINDARLKTIDDVIKFIEDKSTKFYVIPMIEVVFTRIKTLRGNISTETEENVQSTKPTTETKKKVQSELAMATFSLAKPLRAYASSTGDIILRDLSLKSYRQLNRLNREDVKPVCSAIIKKADELKTQLAPFGVTTDMITAANTKLGLWDDWASAVNLKRASFNNNISDSDKAIREILMLMEEQLDPLVNSIPDEQDLVNEYNLTRKIIHPGRTVTQLYFLVLELEPDGERKPVYQADITARMTYTDKKGVTHQVERKGKTNIDGEVSFRPVRYGFYDWEVAKAGFAGAVGLQQRITQGRINRIEVLLIPEAGE